MATTLYIISAIIIVIIAVQIMRKGLKVRVLIPNPFTAIYYDIKQFLSASGRDQLQRDNQHMHFWVSLVFGSAAALLAELISNSTNGILFSVIIGGFSMFVLNAVREAIKHYSCGKDRLGRYIVPMDWKDVRFGMYGGLIGGALGYLLILIFKGI